MAMGQRIWQVVAVAWLGGTQYAGGTDVVAVE